MEYVVGSVAALISGNVTPNRPKLIRRAFTPTKHQPSPNVTPKSEIEDRSIFLSPTLQKKKAVVKKSPKRIFENPDTNVSDHSDDNSSVLSPKADKGKRHLKHELEADEMVKNALISPKSPNVTLDVSSESGSMKKRVNNASSQQMEENTPKKKKNKQKKSLSGSTDNVETEDKENTSNKGEISNILDIEINKRKSPNNKNLHSNKQKNKSKNEESQEIKVNNDEKNTVQEVKNEINQQNKKKNKKRKKSNKQKNQVEEVNKTIITDSKDENTKVTTQSVTEISPKKKNKHKKKLKSEKLNDDQTEPMETDTQDIKGSNKNDDSKQKLSKKKNKQYVNPNAITNKESDSEHDSDDEMESEDQEINNDILNKDQPESSDDEEEKEKPAKKAEKVEVNTEEVKRTLFVGNVPFSTKCKKEIKRIFNKHGQIETIRIRTVPVKDARVTPKLAVIKNELHPDRSTVNVYIRYAEPSSVDKALVENNTVLNDHHLRVTKSDTTGVHHDPNCSVFVGNLPFALEDEALRSKFENCGQIESVRIIRDRKTNAGKGFGYVNFASRDGVELALALSEEDLTIKNRILRVKRCTQATHKQTQKRDFNRNQQTHQHKGNFKGRNQWSKNQGGAGDRQQQKEDGGDGALRRNMKKRHNQDSSDDPPSKRQKNINQPNKEKKVRKEFVGMTSEKKKKQKFNKGQKKKKALSEILTKKVS